MDRKLSKRNIQEEPNATITKATPTSVQYTTTDTSTGTKTTTDMPIKQGQNPFTKTSDGKVILDKTKLPSSMKTPTGQQSGSSTDQQSSGQSQQQLKPGDKVELASVDHELESIKKFAGL